MVILKGKMNETSHNQFSHLKIHTQYSICEGALKISDLSNYCKTNKTKALGLCDSNNLFGALEFSESISKSGTQPIIGTQLNVKYKDYFGKIPLFARNFEGYKNLIKLSSKSFLEIKENEEPHCLLQDIQACSEGLTIFSGSADGLIGKLFFQNLNRDIIYLFKQLKQTFNDNIYIEIQRHNDIGEKDFEIFLLGSSLKLDLPLIATQEVFYLTKDIYEAHDALLCVGEKTYIN